MKPIDDFSFLKNNRVSQDMTNLIRFYLPIIGADAVVVYQYLTSFYDDGQARHKFAEILNHTLFDLPRFENALAVLTGMDLVVFYKAMDHYVIKLNEPLSAERFLSHAVYRNLLESHIGELALAELQPEQVDETSWQNLSKKFSQIFSDKGELDIQPGRLKNDFDLDSFKKRMMADGLSFTQEKQDVISLYNLSERYKLTWFDLYQLAKETASRHKIMPKRILAKLKEPKAVSASELTKEEQIVLREAKSTSADSFLAKIKQGRQAMVVTADERKILQELADMGFLDEVINIMVLYTFNKTKSANLSRRYIMKLANDFSYQKIATAQEAILKMREGRQTSKSAPKANQKSSVPEWSNPDYKEETTPQEQQKLDEMKRQLLAKLGKGED